LVTAPEFENGLYLFFIVFLERQCLIYPFFLTSGRAGLCEQETVRTVGVLLVLQLPFVSFACITHVTGDIHDLALSILNVHRLAWVHFLNTRADVSLHGCSWIGSQMACLLYQRFNCRIDGHLASGHVADRHYSVPTAYWFVVILVYCVAFSHGPHAMALALYVTACYFLNSSFAAMHGVRQTRS